MSRKALKLFIADRRDLLGGRLLPILNGLRLARASGTDFRMTWVRGDDAFLALVSPIEELFAGELVLPENEGGFIIGIDDPRLLASRGDVLFHATPENRASHMRDMLVSPADVPVLRLDRRLSLYALFAGERYASVRSALSTLFTQLPKSPALADAIRRLNQAISRVDGIALHARFLHLTGQSLMQDNRLESYATPHTLRLMIGRLLDTHDKVLLGSDSLAFIRDMKGLFPRRIVTLGDVLDTGSLSPLQRAMMDILFLGRGRSVVGPTSAFGMLASVLGDRPFVNSAHYAIREGLLEGDTTGSLALAKAIQVPGFFGRLAREAAGASFHLALRHAAMGLELIGVSLASLFAENTAASFFTGYTVTFEKGYALAAAAERHDILQTLKELHAMLGERRSHFGMPRPDSGDRTGALLNLAIDIALSDHLPFPACLEAWEHLAGRATALQINPRGLLLRGVKIYRDFGRFADSADHARRAVATDPDFADAHYQLALALHGAGAVDEALPVAREAVRLDGEVAEYWHLLGRLEMGRDGEEALRCLERASMIEPGNPAFELPVER